MKRTIVLMALLLAACSPHFKRGEMEGALRAQAPMFDDASIAAIDLQPQNQETSTIRCGSRLMTLRIAVSQPLSGRAWSAAEIAEIGSWEEPLRRAGWILQVSVLPQSLIGVCDTGSGQCAVDANRKAAARIGADALLVMNPVTQVETYTNPLVLLDFTIIGLWLAPSHHTDAIALLEGTLIDNRNQYVYAFARGEGEHKSVRPMIYAAVDQADLAAREQALRTFGKIFVQQSARREVE